MGSCCSTDEDKQNINIDRKDNTRKKPADKGSKNTGIFSSSINSFPLFFVNLSEKYS